MNREHEATRIMRITRFGWNQDLTASEYGKPERREHIQTRSKKNDRLPSNKPAA